MGSWYGNFFRCHTGEVETFFDTMRLTTNISDNNLHLGEEEKSSHSGAEATNGMIESIRNLISEDNVQALTSMEDAWTSAFNDWKAPVHPNYEDPCQRLEVVGESARSPWEVMMQDELKHGGHLPPPHPHWQQEAIKEPEWTVLILIFNDNLNDMDCVMIQQMLQARVSKNRGETVTGAAKVVESRMKDLLAKQEEERRR